MRGDIAAALTELRAQYDIGADPAVVLADLAEFTHFVTRVKVVPAVADDPSLIEVERGRGRALRREALDAGAFAYLADAAQGHCRGRRRRPPARGRRDGAGADRLCGRSADAGRSDPLARWKRAGLPPVRGCAGVVAGDGRLGAAIRDRLRFEASRVDTARGGPRAALAPAGDPSMRSPVPEAECRRRWWSAVSRI